MNIKRKFLLVGTVIIALLLFLLLAIRFIFGSVENSFSENTATSDKANAFQEIYSNGLQCGQALRNVFIDPKNEQGKENFKKGIQDLVKSYSELEKVDSNVAIKLKDKYSLFMDDLNKLEKMIISGEMITTEHLKSNTKVWREIKEDITKNLKETKKIAENAKNEFSSYLSKMLIFATVGILLFIIAISIILFIFSKNIVLSIATIQTGLTSFFSFLNRETDKAELFNLNSKDEFGQMAVIINENISSIEKGFMADAEMIENMTHVMNRVKNGWYSEFVEATAHNPSLVDLKVILNDMLKGNRARLLDITEKLESYAKHDYTLNVQMNPADEKGGILERLVIQCTVP
ncbi:MAG: hypothetical protein Q7S59_06075 [Sulfurimonas sp.]|nr:hypothetical protein [Sulfurimonas sp.]